MKLITNVAADCSQLRSLAGVVSLPQLTTTRPATRYHILFAERSAPSMATSRRASTTAASATSPSQGANENSTTRSSQQNPAYELLRITGDGRCMFRSLAQGAHLASSAEAGLPIALLPPSEEIAEADSLRQVVCDELLRRKDDIAPFIDIDYGSSFETYVQRMRQPGCWGGTCPYFAVCCLSISDFEKTIPSHGQQIAP